jgi:hypothetical protein
VWRALAIGASMLFVGVGAVIGGIALRNGQRGDELVADVVRFSEARRRPVHRPPEGPGTFEGCAAPLVDEVADGGILLAPSQTFAWIAPEDVREQVQRLLDGGLAFADLAAPIRADFDAMEPWAARLAACTQAQAVGVEDGLGPFGDWNHPRQAITIALQKSAKVNAAAMRKSLASGNADAAVSRCADVLALARDGQLDKGLVGGMVAAAILKSIVPACGTALFHASPESARGFREELGRIRAGLLSFSQILAIERAQMQLFLFGRYLSSDQLSRLPTSARALALGSESNSTSARAVALWLWWGAYDRRLKRLVEAGDAPDRDALLRVIEGEVGAVELFLLDGSPPSGWVNFARRHDNVGRGFDLLESAARLRTGDSELAGVSVAGEGDVVLSVEWFNPSGSERLMIAARAAQ